AGVTDGRLQHGGVDVQPALAEAVVVLNGAATAQERGVNRGTVQQRPRGVDVTLQAGCRRPQQCDRARDMGAGHRGAGVARISVPGNRGAHGAARSGDVRLDLAVLAVATARGRGQTVARVVVADRVRDDPAARRSGRVAAQLPLLPLAKTPKMPAVCQSSMMSSMNGSLLGDWVPHELLMMSGAFVGSASEPSSLVGASIH